MIKREPFPEEWDAWEKSIAEGIEPATAARKLGEDNFGERLTSLAFKRQNPERHAKAIELGREAREGIANDRGESWALKDDADPRMKMAYLKAESSRYRQGDRVEVTGDGGGPVQIEHKGVDVIELRRILEQHGAFDVEGEATEEAELVETLPGSGELLPARPE